MIKRAILHVENTDKLVDLAKYLSSSGWTILSANKTEEHLRNNKIPVQQEPALVDNNYYINESSQLIKKILHTRYNLPDYVETTPSDDENNLFILCVNITPVININILSENRSTPIRPLNMYISTILKNAFVNYENILILTDPADYDEAIIQLKTNNITHEFRTYLAAKALNLVSAYDGGLACSILQNKQYSQAFMNYLTLPFKRDIMLEQGANPHQQACIYKSPTESGILDGFLKLPGHTISYNVAVDVAFAWEQISTLFSILKNRFVIKSTNCDGYEYTTQFTPITGTVFTRAVKVNTIVGAALSTNVLDSFKKTYTYDTENIVDAIFASSAVIDKEAAEEIVKCNFAALVAPGYTAEAKEVFKDSKTELVSSSKTTKINYDGKLVNGGLILQQKDTTLFDHWVVKTKKRPTQFQIDEMAIGMLLVMGLRSYSVALIKDNAVVGITEACPSTAQAIDEAYANAKKHRRLNASTVKKSEDGNNTLADILVCDTALPFNDSLRKIIIDEGVTAIIHTGGTPADNDFIKYCDEKGISMVFTEMTHIRF